MMDWKEFVNTLTIGQLTALDVKYQLVCKWREGVRKPPGYAQKLIRTLVSGGDYQAGLAAGIRDGIRQATEKGGSARNSLPDQVFAACFNDPTMAAKIIESAREGVAHNARANAA